jgi:hypothetical protein
LKAPFLSYPFHPCLHSLSAPKPFASFLSRIRELAAKFCTVPYCTIRYLTALLTTSSVSSRPLIPTKQRREANAHHNPLLKPPTSFSEPDRLIRATFSSVTYCSIRYRTALLTTSSLTSRPQTHLCGAQQPEPLHKLLP